MNIERVLSRSEKTVRIQFRIQALQWSIEEEIRTQEVVGRRCGGGGEEIS